MNNPSIGLKNARLKNIKRAAGKENTCHIDTTLDDEYHICAQWYLTSRIFITLPYLPIYFSEPNLISFLALVKVLLHVRHTYSTYLLLIPSKGALALCKD